MYIFRAPDEYTVDKLLKRRGEGGRLADYGETVLWKTRWKVFITLCIFCEPFAAVTEMGRNAPAFAGFATFCALQASIFWLYKANADVV